MFAIRARRRTVTEGDFLKAVNKVRGGGRRPLGGASRWRGVGGRLAGGQGRHGGASAAACSARRHLLPPLPPPASAPPGHPGVPKVQQHAALPGVPLKEGGSTMEAAA